MSSWNRYVSNYWNSDDSMVNWNFESLTKFSVYHKVYYTQIFELPRVYWNLGAPEVHWNLWAPEVYWNLWAPEVYWNLWAPEGITLLKSVLPKRYTEIAGVYWKFWDLDELKSELVENTTKIQYNFSILLFKNHIFSRRLRRRGILKIENLVQRAWVGAPPAHTLCGLSVSHALSNENCYSPRNS